MGKTQLCQTGLIYKPHSERIYIVTNYALNLKKKKENHVLWLSCDRYMTLLPDSM